MQARGLCPGFFVFPAYAGMFPLQLPHRTHLDCFPRIRGDVPADQVADQLQSGFSPHTRGCSPFCWGKITFPFVFPAYAGMFRKPHSFPWLLDGFPRIRGDVPSRWSERHRKETFSPHTRGCSGKPLMKFFELTVFPAYAGMFPRRGGGIPPMAGFFSPHTRGCSLTMIDTHAFLQVFPAYAGMFLKSSSFRRALVGFPRIRGDVPRRRIWICG